MDNNEPVICGIRCDVKNCIHNNGCSCCTADQIYVKCDCGNPEHTCCDTFSEI